MPSSLPRHNITCNNNALKSCVTPPPVDLTPLKWGADGVVWTSEFEPLPCRPVQLRLRPKLRESNLFFQ